MTIVGRSTSFQVHYDNPAEEDTAYPEYGMYLSSISRRDVSLCLQYKCSGHVFDPDHPMVQINDVATQVQVRISGANCAIE